MAKSVGAMVVSLMLGSGAMTVFHGALGARAEALGLAVVGAALLATSQILSSARTTVQKPTEVTSEA